MIPSAFEAKCARSLLALALILAGCAFAPRVEAQPTGQAAERAEEEFLKINSLFNQELWKIAIPRYEKLLRDHPNFARSSTVHYALAVCHHRVSHELAQSAGPSEAALAGIKRSVFHSREAVRDKRLPDRAQALELLAESLAELDEHRSARKVWAALVKSSEGADRARALEGLAEALAALGNSPEAATKYAEALALYEAAARQDPGSASAQSDVERVHYRRGLALFGEAKTLAEARRVFEALASGTGSYRDQAAYMLALAAQEAGDTQRALADFRQLASRLEKSIDPAAQELRASALYGVGTLLFEEKQYAEVAQLFEGFASRFPRSEHRDASRLFLGRALVEGSQLRRGAEILNGLRRSEAVGPEAHLHLARVYSARGKAEQALKILQSARKAFPEGRFLTVLGIEEALALIAAERTGEAVPLLRELAAREGTRGGDSAGRDGDSAGRDGDSAGRGGDSAGRDGDSAGRDHATYLLAYALHIGGETAEAQTICQSFLERFPASEFGDRVRQLEAENLLLEAQYPEAIARYEALLEASEGNTEERRALRLRLAEARFHAGDPRAALVELERVAAAAKSAGVEVLGKEAGLASFHYLAGDAAYSLEDWPRAARELRQYLGERRDTGATDAAAVEDARFKLAHSLQLAGDEKAATAIYSQLLAGGVTGAQAARARFEFAKLAATAGRLDEAKRELRKLLEQGAEGTEPLRPHLYNHLAWIAQNEQASDEAITWYRRLTKEFPGHELEAEALYGLALNLQTAGRAEEAQAVMKDLEAKHPGSDIALKVRLQEAVNLSRQGNNQSALAKLEALATNDLPPALEFLRLYELAWCHRGLEALDEARAIYRQLIDRAHKQPEADPDGLGDAARLELAELEFDAGEVARSRKLLGTLIGKAGPQQEKALYRLAWCYYRERSRELAGVRRSFAAKFPASDYRREVDLLHARQLVEEGKHCDAARIFEEVAKAGGPEAGLARVHQAESLNESGQSAAARQLLESFIAKEPRSPHRTRAEFALGQAAEKLNELDRALEHYRRAARDRTELAARAQFQIGQCHAARKKYEDAIVEYLQVPGRFRNADWTSRALLQVAGCFEQLDDPDKARRYYQQVATDYPDRKEARLARERLSRLP